MARSSNKSRSSRSRSSRAVSKSAATGRFVSRKTMTAAQAVTAPVRTLAGATQKKSPVSAAAKQRIAAAREAMKAGAISKQEFEERKRSYEYFGQREAAGYSAFDLRY